MIPFPALVLARTHVIRSLNILCESLMEQAVALSCHNIIFPLRTQKLRVNTEKPDMLSARQQSQKLSERERVGGGWREGGVFIPFTHRAPLGRSYSIHLAHETFYFVPSAAVEEAEWRFITTVVHSSPTGLAQRGAMFFRTAF